MRESDIVTQPRQILSAQLAHAKERLTTPSRVLVIAVVVRCELELAGAAGLGVGRVHRVASHALAHADPGVFTLLEILQVC